MDYICNRLHIARQLNFEKISSRRMGIFPTASVGWGGWQLSRVAMQYGHYVLYVSAVMSDGACLYW